MQFSKIYYNRTGFLFQPLVWNLEGFVILKAARGAWVR